MMVVVRRTASVVVVRRAIRHRSFSCLGFASAALPIIATITSASVVFLRVDLRARLVSGKSGRFLNDLSVAPAGALPLGTVYPGLKPGAIVGLSLRDNQIIH
jgi:hypothetical protein